MKIQFKVLSNLSIGEGLRLSLILLDFHTSDLNSSKAHRVKSLDFKSTNCEIFPSP